jgi:hypothetical protein
VVGLLGGQEGRIGGEREVNTRETFWCRIKLCHHDDVSKATHGTRLVWNSLRSTFREPSNRRDAVIEDTTWAISLFKLGKLGETTPRFFLQMS